MAISYHYAARFIGQPVIAQCVGGHKYYGTVHSVTPNEVVLRRFSPGTMRVAGQSKMMSLDTADKPNKLEMKDVQYYPYGAAGYGYGRGALIALPLYVLLALGLLWI